MGKSTIRRESTREERTEIFSRKKSARHEPQWVGGEKSLLCDHGSELRLGGRENRSAKIINGMENIYTHIYIYVLFNHGTHATKNIYMSNHGTHATNHCVTAS